MHDTVLKLHLANRLFRGAKYEEAIRLYDELAVESPRNHWARLNAALACFARGKVAEALERLARVDVSEQLGREVIEAARSMIARAALKASSTEDIDATGDVPRPVRTLLCLRADRKFPSGFPFELALPPLKGNKNDFSHIEEEARHVATARRKPREGGGYNVRVHIIASVAGEERARQVVQEVEAQSYPRDLLTLTLLSPPMRLLSSPAIDVHHLSSADHSLFWKLPDSIILGDSDCVFFLDDDVSLDEIAIERTCQYFQVSSNIVIGFVPVASGGSVYLRADEEADRVAWRKERYPFRKIRAPRFGIATRLLREVGGFESRFERPELACMELAYKAYNYGAYFIPIHVPQAAGGRHLRAAYQASAADKRLFEELCPVNWYRKHDGFYEVPKVSVYIPSFNNAKYIVEAVDSVLNQDFQDLEVCISDDGSTDNTLELLERRYSNEARVRWIVNQNGGIGFASNRAILASRGMYIAQLDSDDRLKQGAVRRLAEYLDEHPEVGCVYGSCERIDRNGQYMKDEYRYPVFSREKMMMTSIVHHFRMFRRQAWKRTEGFREDILNAVDYDMFLKLSEVTELHHVDEVLYQRRWHGANTSIVNEGKQSENTHVVLNKALERIGARVRWEVYAPNPKEPRKVSYRRVRRTLRVFQWPDYSGSNPYQKLLYGTVRASFETFAGDIGSALKAVHDCSDANNVVFHIHWLNRLLAGVKSAEDLERRSSEFLGKLRLFKERGGKVVWTIHNLVSHEAQFPLNEIELGNKLIELSDRIHVHFLQSVPEIAAVYRLPSEKIRISEHGNYRAYYPNYVSRATARKQLGFAERDIVFASVGQVRPYKGLETLVKSFKALIGDPSVKLLIAGKFSYDFRSYVDRELGADRAGNVILIDSFIAKHDLQILLNAADVAVFPYSRVLTSGSLMLALSFGVPAIVPEVGMTREVLKDSKAGFVYRGGSSELTEVLAEAVALKKSGELGEMKQHAFDVADRYQWPDFSQTVIV